MFKRFHCLRLSRPLAIIDLETSGINTANDRIVEIAILRVEPDGKTTRYVKRVNPGAPIPPAAAAIHGISNADLDHCPSFADIHRKVQRILEDCDLAGYNLKRFDVPFLLAEFKRVGGSLGINGRAIIDVQEIFYRHEPRDLASAAKLYLGREHSGAHSADADAAVTAAILDAQLARYSKLPRTVSGLHEQFKGLDLARRFRLEDSAAVFNFGKHQGRRLEEVAVTDPDYLEWMLQQDFFDDVKAMVQQALTHRRFD